MDIRILGAMEAAVGDSLIDLGPPRQRTVFAVLVSEANRIVPLDRLIELVWGETPPARATGALQAYVHNLRRVLEPSRSPRTQPTVLLTRAPGYLLRIDPDHIDAVRFETLATTGHRHLLEGRPSAAMGVLTEALALWRGRAFCDFTYEPFAQGPAARLEQVRLIATEDKLEAQLAVGDHSGSVLGLEALVVEYPLRERLWALLMTALYRSGRQADALRAYSEARRLLGEELGIEPGAALRCLEADVLAQSSSLDWRPSPEECPPIPLGGASSPLAPGHDAPLIGRRSELRLLETALAEAAVGRGQLVLVSGEPGIGKTTLIEEIVLRAEARGMAVACGRADEGEGAPPFWVWTQVLTSVLGQFDGEQVAAAAGIGGAELAQVLPQIKEVVGDLPSPPPLEPAAARFRLHESICSFLDRLASRRPILVVLDDLHWADASSLQLAARLAGRLAKTRIVLAATYRSVDPRPGRDLTEVLGMLARTPAARTQIMLEGLDQDSVSRLVARTVGFDPAPGVTATVWARSDGNPFYAGELARLLLADPSSLNDAAAVPAGVSQVIRRRLVRLPEATRDLLDAAAVAGREFDLRVVARATGVDEDGALELIDSAVATGLVIEDGAGFGRYRFAHALLQQAIHREIAGLRRTRLHARLGHALVAVHGKQACPAELAHHFYEAAAIIGPDRGFAANLSAAQDAEEKLAYEAAEAHLGRALELVARIPDGPDRRRREFTVQHRLAVMLTLVHGMTAPRAWAAWARAQELAAESGERVELLASLWGPVPGAGARGDFALVHRLGEELLSAASAFDDSTFALAGHLAMGNAAWFTGSPAVALEHFAKVRGHDQEELDPAVREVFGWIDPSLTALVIGALALWQTGDDESARAWMRQAVARSERSGHPFKVGVGMTFDALLAALSGDVALARRRADELGTWCDQYGFSDLRAEANIVGGWARMREGQHEAGRQLISEGLAAHEAAQFRAMRSLHLWLLADASRRQGRPEDALVALDDAAATVELTGERFLEAEIHRLRAEVTLDQSPCRTEEAERLLLSAVAVADAQGAPRLRRRAEHALHAIR